MIKENDTVAYFGEEFTVKSVSGEMAVIGNKEHGYTVPCSTLAVLASAEPVKKPAKKAKKAAAE